MQQSTRRVVVLVSVVAVGFGVLLYPAASKWFTARAEANTLGQFAAVVHGSGSQVSDLVASAHRYNSQLTALHVENITAAMANADVDYQSQLHSTASDVMAEVTIPVIDVRLPVYHCMNEGVLDRGAEHVYGSSLPVGGPSTHTVISAHSGLVQAQMFTRLHDLVVGDEFFITAAGSTLRYVVDSIAVVEPTDASALQVVPGEDFATLLTCTPVNINSHRLLVRGVRAEFTADAAARMAVSPPAPWWLLWWCVGVATAALAASGATVASRRPARQAAHRRHRRVAASTSKEAGHDIA